MSRSDPIIFNKPRTREKEINERARERKIEREKDREKRRERKTKTKRGGKKKSEGTRRTAEQKTLQCFIYSLPLSLYLH
jgi:hypothetical protein